MSKATLARKPGEINGGFGAFCNMIMQVGGALTVLSSLPIAGYICLTVMDNHSRGILIEQKLNDYIGVQHNAIGEIKNRHEKDLNSVNQRLERYAELIRENSKK
jgi:hypothetical protein